MAHLPRHSVFVVLLDLNVFDKEGRTACHTDAENGKFTPNIYKVCTLSLIYKCSWIDILAFFGINVLDIAREQRLVRLPHTHLLGSSLELPGQKIVVPVELRNDVDLARTNLLSRMFETYAQ